MDRLWLIHRHRAVSRDVFPPRGLSGAFSLEAIITPSQQFYALELSTSIVGGTNLFINGSPYSALFFAEPMSMGRYCSREICLAEEVRMLENVVQCRKGAVYRLAERRPRQFPGESKLA